MYETRLARGSSWFCACNRSILLEPTWWSSAHGTNTNLLAGFSATGMHWRRTGSSKFWLDCWANLRLSLTDGAEDIYHVFIFPKYPSELPSEYDSVELALLLLTEADSKNAKEHFEFGQFVFSVFGKPWENVLESVSDNTTSKKAFVRHVVPLNHKGVSVTVPLIRPGREESHLRVGIDCQAFKHMQSLICKILYQFLAAQLRKEKTLRPKLDNEMR